MCLILVKPANVEPPFSWLENALHHNHDGFGMMWYDKDKARVCVAKTPNRPKLKRIAEFIRGKEIALHFRFATEGAVHQRNTHPMPVLRRELHGVDLYLMHNGIIPIKTPSRHASDTWAFVYQLLRPDLEKNPDTIRDPNYQKWLSNEWLWGSKLVLMDDKGDLIYINKDEGYERNGIWLSNLYSIGSPIGAWRRYAKIEVEPELDTLTLERIRDMSYTQILDEVENNPDAAADFIFGLKDHT